VSITSQVSATATLSGDKSETTVLTDPPNASAPWGFREVALSTGNNTIAIPTGAQRVFIRKPSNNTVALLYKDNPGDTGKACSLTLWDSFTFAASATQIVINAASGVTVTMGWT